MTGVLMCGVPSNTRMTRSARMCDHGLSTAFFPLVSGRELKLCTEDGGAIGEYELGVRFSL